MKTNIVRWDIMRLRRVFKWGGWALLIYMVLFVITTISYTSTQIKHATEDEKKASVTSLRDLKQPSKQFESVAMTAKVEDGLPLRNELIDQATDSLLIAQYTVAKDDSGLIFMQKLKEAAERGVRIQLLLNGLSNNTGNNSYLNLLADYDNVTIKIVGGFSFFKPWKINDVIHDKLIIVDNDYLMASGRNIKDRFLILDDEKPAARDMDILFKNRTKSIDDGLIHQGTTYFSQLWKDSKGKLWQSHLSTTQKQRKQKKWAKEYDSLLVTHDKLLQRNVLKQMTFHPIKNSLFVHNSTDSLIKKPIVWHQVTSLVNESDQPIKWMSPYIILTKNMTSFLEQPEKKDITLYTNTMSNSPNVMAFSGYWQQKKDLLKSYNIWEYQGKDSLHQKVFTLSDDILGIGSMNIDSRSAFLSSENMFIVNSPSATKELNDIIQTYEKNSLQAKGKQTFYPKETLEALKTKPSKKALVTLLSWIAPLTKPYL